MPVDPSFAISGPEWGVGGIAPLQQAQGAEAAQPSQGTGFGGMLADQIKGLEATQQEAATASQALATGQTNDVASTVAAVERAKLSMELAGTVRQKAVEAYQEIFRTQV